MKTLTLFLMFLIPAFAAQADEVTIKIPHDPGAQHAMVEKSGNTKQRVVVTRRDGLFGALYSRHVYNCERRTVALLETGHDLESLSSSTASGSMLPVVDDSTAYYIESQACG